MAGLAGRSHRVGRVDRPRGEFVLVVAGAPEPGPVDDDTVLAALRRRLDGGASKRDAATDVARELGVAERRRLQPGDHPPVAPTRAPARRLSVTRPGEADSMLPVLLTLVVASVVFGAVMWVVLARQAAWSRDARCGPRSTPSTRWRATSWAISSPRAHARCTCEVRPSTIRWTTWPASSLRFASWWPVCSATGSTSRAGLRPGSRRRPVRAPTWPPSPARSGRPWPARSPEASGASAWPTTCCGGPASSRASATRSARPPTAGTIPDFTFLLPDGDVLHMDVKFPRRQLPALPRGPPTPIASSTGGHFLARRARPGEGADGPRLRRSAAHARLPTALHPQRECLRLHARTGPRAPRPRPAPSGSCSARRPPCSRCSPSCARPSTTSGSNRPRARSSTASAPSPGSGSASPTRSTRWAASSTVRRRPSVELAGTRRNQLQRAVDAVVDLRERRGIDGADGDEPSLCTSTLSTRRHRAWAATVPRVRSAARARFTVATFVEVPSGVGHVVVLTLPDDVDHLVSVKITPGHAPTVVRRTGRRETSFPPHGGRR